MIRSKNDLTEYLIADAKAHGVDSWTWWHAAKNPPLYFQRLMRRVEYYENCRQGDWIGRKWLFVLKIYFTVISILLGFTIPPNTFGPGLVINHWGTIVVSSLARIGKNCRLNACVNIGIKDGAAPLIGDNAYIGPGAKLFGGIELGDDVVIGANAVVNASFPGCVTLGGIPARIIKSGNHGGDAG